MEWFADVIEHRLVRCEYTVEADTAEEARDKLERGETVGEKDVASDDVLERTVISDPWQCGGELPEPVK